MRLRWWLLALFVGPLVVSFLPDRPAHGYGAVWYALPLLLLWLRPAHRARLLLYGAGWVLQVLAYPAIDVGVLGWVLLVPYLLARRRDDGASWWRAAYLFGFLRAHLGYYWLGEVHYTAWIGVSLGSAFVFVATFELVLRRLTLFPFALRVATGWVLYEWVHSWFLGGFPWLFLAHTQYRYLPVIQAADLVGAYGISFLLAYAQAAALSPGRAPRVAAAVLLAATLGYGFARDGGAPRDEAGDRPVVLMIQTAAPHGVKASTHGRVEPGRPLGELTLDALDQHGEAALVVWPETMFPGRYVEGDPAESVNWGQALRFARRAGRPFVYGVGVYPSRERLHRGYNAAVLVRADGTVGGIYRKQRLVPMGEEFLPRRVFPERWCDAWFSWLVENAGMNANADLDAGEGHVTLDAGPGLRCAVLICFEGLYPDMARDAVRVGDADLVLHLVNNGWFGDTWEQHQCIASWVFRAVETRTPFLSCANGGITCAVGPRGDLLGSVDEVFRQGSLAVAVPRRWPDPPFLHGGAWGLPVALAIAAAALWTRRSRAAAVGSPPAA